MSFDKKYFSLQCVVSFRTSSLSKLSFLLQGHIETIFDCKFQPDNADHLATASFDGTIKVWDIRSMKSVSPRYNIMRSDKPLIHCVSGLVVECSLQEPEVVGSFWRTRPHFLNGSLYV